MGKFFCTPDMVMLGELPSAGALLEKLRDKVSGEIDIEAEGLNRYIVYTPFMFDDGDHYVVILRNEHGRWVLSDEGHTLMHLSYEGLDPLKGSRGNIVEETLAAHGIETIAGELRLIVPDEDFGNALFSFVQALARTSTVAQITRERVRTTFYEDSRSRGNSPENTGKTGQLATSGHRPLGHE